VRAGVKVEAGLTNASWKRRPVVSGAKVALVFTPRPSGNEKAPPLHCFS